MDNKEMQELHFAQQQYAQILSARYSHNPSYAANEAIYVVTDKQNQTITTLVNNNKACTHEFSRHGSEIVG